MGYSITAHGGFKLKGVHDLEVLREAIKEINGKKGYSEEYSPWFIEDHYQLTVGHGEMPYGWMERLPAALTKLKEYGITCSGILEWDGEEEWDFGRIIMKESVATVEEGYKAYRNPQSIEDYVRM